MQDQRDRPWRGERLSHPPRDTRQWSALGMSCLSMYETRRAPAWHVGRQTMCSAGSLGAERRAAQGERRVTPSGAMRDGAAVPQRSGAVQAAAICQRSASRRSASPTPRDHAAASCSLALDGPPRVWRLCPCRAVLGRHAMPAPPLRIPSRRPHCAATDGTKRRATPSSSQTLPPSRMQENHWESELRVGHLHRYPHEQAQERMLQSRS